MKWSSALVPALRCLGTSFKDHGHPLSIGCTSCNKGPEDKRVEWMKDSYVFSVYSFSKSKYDKIPPARCKNLTDLCTSLHNHCHPLGIASTSCYQSPVDIGFITPPRLGCLRSHYIELLLQLQSLWNSSPSKTCWQIYSEQSMTISL